MIKKYNEYMNNAESEFAKLQAKFNGLTLDELIHQSKIYEIEDEFEKLKETYGSDDLVSKIDDFGQCISNVKKAKLMISDSHGKVNIF